MIIPLIWNGDCYFVQYSDNVVFDITVIGDIILTFLYNTCFQFQS